MEIMYHGRPFILEDRETEISLISKEKDEQGRKTNLSFTKDKEKSSKDVEALSKLIKRQIVTNFHITVEKALESSMLADVEAFDVDAMVVGDCTTSHRN